MNDFEDELSGVPLASPSPAFDARMRALLDQAPAADAQQKRRMVPLWVALVSSVACVVLGFALRTAFVPQTPADQPAPVVCIVRPEKVLSDWFNGVPDRAPFGWDPSRVRVVTSASPRG